VLPEQERLVARVLGIPCAFNNAVAPGAVSGIGASDARGIAVVSRQGAETILVAVDERRDRAELAREALDLGAVDQLLTFQYAAEQQADDDQYNGNLDEGETGLLAFHFAYLLRWVVTISIKHDSCQGIMTKVMRIAGISVIRRTLALDECRVFDTFYSVRLT